MLEAGRPLNQDGGGAVASASIADGGIWKGTGLEWLQRRRKVCGQVATESECVGAFVFAERASI